MTFKPPKVYAHQKLAFQQDLQSDPTLTNVQKGLITTIATNYDPAEGHSPVSVSFMARGAGTTAKVAKRYAKALPDTGRVQVKRKGEGTRPTWWLVNWFYRGSAYIREKHGGAVEDIRNPLVVPAMSLIDEVLVVPKVSPPDSDMLGTTRSASGPQPGTESHLYPLRGNINEVFAPAPAGGLAAPPGEAKTDRLPQILDLTVTAATIAEVGGKSTLTVTLETDSIGDEYNDIFEEIIVIESLSSSEQDAGQRKLLKLMSAADIDAVHDASDLVGAKLQAVDRLSGLIFLPTNSGSRKALLNSMGLAT